MEGLFLKAAVLLVILIEERVAPTMLDRDRRALLNAIIDRISDKKQITEIILINWVMMVLSTCVVVFNLHTNIELQSRYSALLLPHFD